MGPNEEQNSYLHHFKSEIFLLLLQWQRRTITFIAHFDDVPRIVKLSTSVSLEMKFF